MRIKLHHELKELLPHLAEMSGNEVKLCLLLNLKRGWVEVSFDDLARPCGWSLSTLKRTIRDLKNGSRIDVERAWVKPDPIAAQPLSAGVKSDTDHKIAVVNSDPTKVHEVKTDPHSQVSGVNSDHQVPDVPSGVVVPQDSKTLGLPGIPARCRFTDELSPASKDLFEFVGFACHRRFLSRGFMTIVEKYAKLRPWPRPGMLASKLIERALHWQRKRRKEGLDVLLYAWPPGFQQWRDTRRRQERLAGKAERRARAA